MVLNRTVYYERFILFCGHDNAGRPIQRMVLVNPAGHNSVEDNHCNDGRLTRKRFDFTFGTNSAPFKLEALPSLAINGLHTGRSIFVELGGFNTPNKTGFDRPIRLGLTILKTANEKDPEDVLLSIESATREEQKTIVDLVHLELGRLNLETTSPHLPRNLKTAMSFVDAWTNHLGLSTETAFAGDRRS